MLRVSGAVLISMAVMGCVATSPKTSLELPASARQTAFGHAVPAGAPLASQAIVSSQLAGVHQAMAVTPWRVAHFRPNLNMPEFLDADMVNATLMQEKAADIQRQLTQGKAVLMTFPRLVLLPCDDGCTGNKDYEKMAGRFQKSYDDMARSGAGVYRGEIKVKVRWFRQKPLIERLNPISFGQQAFGIEFPIEGNVLTLSSSAFGKNAALEDCVDMVAAKFKLGVIFPVALGLRNHYTVTLDPQYDPTVMQHANSFVASPVRGIKTLVGQTDYSSRFEPMAAAHRSLLPALDGLQAGEGADVGKGKLFDSF